MAGKDFKATIINVQNINGKDVWRIKGKYDLNEQTNRKCQQRKENYKKEPRRNSQLKGKKRNKFKSTLETAKEPVNLKKDQQKLSNL